MHKSLKMDLTNISLNMGVVEMNEKFNIYFSIRSPMESAKDELSNKLSLIASMFKAKYVLNICAFDFTRALRVGSLPEKRH